MNALEERLGIDLRAFAHEGGYRPQAAFRDACMICPVLGRLGYGSPEYEA